MLFLVKNAILAYIALWNEIQQRDDYYPEDIINHNFVKYPNSMVWKIDVYVKITITYFYYAKSPVKLWYL